MRNFLFLIGISILMVSCGKSDEEKVKDLIAEYAKSTLYVPESYDPVETKVDSMFIDIINEKNIKIAARIVELWNESNSLQREIDLNMEERDFWRRGSSEFYRKYSSKVQRDVSKRLEYDNEMFNLINELLKEYWSQANNKELKGYLTRHRFRAKNDAGTTGFCEMIFILNKEKNNVVAAYDVDEPEFQNFMKIIDAVVELGPENINEEPVDIKKSMKKICIMISRYTSYNDIIGGEIKIIHEELDNLNRSSYSTMLDFSVVLQKIEPHLASIERKIGKSSIDHINISTEIVETISNRMLAYVDSSYSENIIDKLSAQETVSFYANQRENLLEAIKVCNKLEKLNMDYSYRIKNFFSR